MGVHMIEAVLALAALGLGALILIFVVPQEASIQFGDLSISMAVVLIPVFIVLFLFGYGYGLRRGRKKGRWFSKQDVP